MIYFLNQPRPIFSKKTFLIVRPNGFAAINVKSTVVPIHHVFDHHIIDFAFSFEHFENFIAEQLFKLNGIRWWAYHDGVIVVKAAIGGENIQMRMIILEITLRAGGKSSVRQPQRQLWHRHRVRLESNKDSALSRRNGSVL